MPILKVIMKHFYLKCTLIAVVIISFVVACGSTWNIKGNRMIVNSCRVDTLQKDTLHYGESK